MADESDSQYSYFHVEKEQDNDCIVEDASSDFSLVDETQSTQAAARQDEDNESKDDDCWSLLINHGDDVKRGDCPSLVAHGDEIAQNSDWSLVTNVRECDDKSTISGTSCSLLGGTTIINRTPTLQSYPSADFVYGMNGYEEGERISEEIDRLLKDEQCPDLYPERKYQRHRKCRVGKKSSNHSFVKRDNEHEHVGAMEDDLIQVIRRRRDENGSIPTTKIDRLFPELMSMGRAALGRRNGRNILDDVLQDLELEGTAMLLHTIDASVPYCDRHMYRGRYSPIPYEYKRYAVKSTNAMLQEDKERITSKAKTKNNAYAPPPNAVLCWQGKRWKIKYELTSSPPDEIKDCPSLLATLRSAPKVHRSNTSYRRAFCPGMASVCSSSYHATYPPAAASAVAEESIDLHFGRSVAVHYASIAGKVHDTMRASLELNKARDQVFPRYNKNAPGLENGQKKIRDCLFAIEGTDAYCDKVEISARLSINRREWVVLGQFNGCRNCHIETPIHLGSCGAASKDGAVHCIALRFRAISWHNKALLRVGAYGYDETPSIVEDEGVGETEAVSRDGKNADATESGVEYIIYRAKPCDDDGGFRRRYAIKEGRSSRYDLPYPPKNKKEWIKQEIKAGYK